MGTLRRTGFAAVLLLAAVLSSAGAHLPELDRFIDYGRRALEKGDVAAATAASDLLLLDEVKVYLGKAEPERHALVREALRAWEQALGDEVRFVEVDASQAQVRFAWTDKVVFEGQHVGGTASWKRAVQRSGSQVRMVLSGEIELSRVAPRGNLLNCDQQMQVALHEVGHILGLDDSRERGEAMSPLDLARPVPRITRGDLDALRSVRTRAQELRLAARSSR